MSRNALSPSHNGVGDELCLGHPQSAACDTSSDTDSDASQLKNQLRMLREENNYLRRELTAASSDSVHHNVTLECDDLKKDLCDAREQLRVYEEKVNASDVELRQRDERIVQLRTELDALHLRVSDVTSQRNIAVEEARHLSSDIASMEFVKENWDVEQHELRNRLQASESLGASLRKRLATTQEKCAQQEAAILDLRNKLSLNAHRHVQTNAQSTSNADIGAFDTSADFTNLSTILNKMVDRQDTMDTMSQAMLHLLQSRTNETTSRAERLKPPTFDPLTDEWEVFHARFDAHCASMGVSTANKLPLLYSVLAGDVHKSLYDAGLLQDASWETVSVFLQSTYGEKRMPEDFEYEFAHTTRHEGEPLRKLAERLQSLKRRAGVASTPRLLSLRFLDAVGRVSWSAYLRHQVLADEITSFETIVNKAVRLEAGEPEQQSTSASPAAPSVHSALASPTPCKSSFVSSRSPPPPPAEKKSAGDSPWTATQALFLDKLVEELVKNQNAAFQRLMDMAETTPVAHATPTSSTTPTPMRRGRRRGSFGRRFGNCFACSSPDHQIRDCPISCDRCLRKGHTAEHCGSRPLNSARGAYEDM